MKMNTRCRYGTRAIIEIAKNPQDEPVKRKVISKNQKISDSYLENILISLKNHGLIRTTRGPKGGYVLAKKSSDITLLDIVEALEGSIAPVECLDDEAVCDMTTSCKARSVWAELLESQTKVLKKTTLKQLVNKKLEAAHE